MTDGKWWSGYLMQSDSKDNNATNCTIHGERRDGKSIQLLYLLDESIDSLPTVKALGHQ